MKKDNVDIVFKDITMDNFEECINLSVAEKQKGFVASNMYSLAEAKADGVSKPYAVYNNTTMVGFVMYWFDKENSKGWLDRVMVAEEYQGNGYGKEIVKEAIKRLKNYSSCKVIRTSAHHDNVIALTLYKQLGFKESGIIEDDEVEMLLIL
jgi:diamine N-acetyltransferase